MTITATLAGHRLVTGRISMPAWGVAWAEATLDEEVPLVGKVSLAVADLTLSVTIVSGGIGPTGRSSYRMALGAAGWGKIIAAKSFANDAGVKASTALIDAAGACGETFDQATLPTSRLGPAWTRDEAAAARELESIAPRNWYVGEDGLTRIGRRASRTVSLPTALIALDRSRGTLTLATESIAAITPGAIVEGLEAVDVLHEFAAGKIRTSIWGKGYAETSRRLDAYRRIFDALDPDRKFRGVYEYRVVFQLGDRVDLQPIRVSIGMPDLQRVTVRPGIPGARANLMPGSRVLVSFVDASPGRPIIVAFEEAEGIGFTPLSITIDATLIEIGEGAILGAARLTDKVVAGPFGGAITTGSLQTRIA